MSLDNELDKLEKMLGYAPLNSSDSFFGDIWDKVKSWFGKKPKYIIPEKSECKEIEEEYEVKETKPEETKKIKEEPDIFRSEL